MLDLAGIASLFWEVSKEWREPEVAAIDPLSAIQQEPVYLDLRAEGHIFRWAYETRLRQLAREGWKPVTERDAIGRPTIFTDRKRELILVYRPGDKIDPAA